jgi:hypothetical protein
MRELSGVVKVQALIDVRETVISTFGAETACETGSATET